MFSNKNNDQSEERIEKVSIIGYNKVDATLTCLQQLQLKLNWRADIPESKQTVFLNDDILFSTHNNVNNYVYPN